VKRRLLGLRPLDQFLDPIEHSLIGDSGRHALVMLDLAVEFDTLVTHFLLVPHFAHRSLAFKIGRLYKGGEAVDLFICAVLTGRPPGTMGRRKASLQRFMPIASASPPERLRARGGSRG
jgi:hypothetical protein